MNEKHNKQLLKQIKTLQTKLTRLESIDKHKKVNRILDESSQLATGILESISDGFFVLDNNMSLVYFNKIAERLLNRKRKDVLGRNLFEAFPEFKGSAIEAEYTQAVKNKTFMNFEIYFDTIPYKNWYKIRIHPQRNGISVYFQIATERKNAEEALRESEEKYRLIAETAAEGIYRVDANGEFTFVNKAYCETFGYKAGELLGKHFSIVIPEARMPQAHKIVNNLNTKKPTRGEFFMRHKLNHEFPAYFSMVRLTRERKPAGFTGILQDITERKQAEQALENAYQKLKDAQEQLIHSGKMAAMGQLAAGISHELNQPLTGIKGFAQAMFADLPKTSPFREDLKKILAQTERMNKIIKNIRLFARKSDFTMRGIDINRPLKDSISLLQQQLKIHNIQVKKTLEQHPLKVEGDSNQLQQVFLNLITNARDAIHSLDCLDRRELTVRSSLSKDRNNAEIVFHDTGCGIPSNDLPNIFNPFFTTKSPSGGIGLGLSIVYRIIEDHDGKIAVESRKNKGTTFKITIPLASRKSL